MRQTSETVVKNTRMEDMPKGGPKSEAARPASRRGWKGVQNSAEPSLFRCLFTLIGILKIISLTMLLSQVRLISGGAVSDVPTTGAVLCFKIAWEPNNSQKFLRSVLSSQSRSIPPTLIWELIILRRRWNRLLSKVIYHFLLLVIDHLVRLSLNMCMQPLFPVEYQDQYQNENDSDDGYGYAHAEGDAVVTVRGRNTRRGWDWRRNGCAWA